MTWRTFSMSTANWIAERQLRSACTPMLATFRCTNISPGGSPTIWFAGTRLSEQPIQRYPGACCCARREKNCGSCRAMSAAQARLLASRCSRGCASGLKVRRILLLGRSAPADRRRRVLLREALEQAVDAFLLDDRVEFRAVGHHQAHALDDDVVHLPGLVGLAHVELDRQRLATGAYELGAHDGVLGVLLAARRQHLQRLALIGRDRIRVGAHQHVAELADQPLLLLGRGLRPRAAHREAGGLLEVDVRQHLLFGELERLLLVPGRELLVALGGGQHLLRDLLYQLVGGQHLGPGGQRESGDSEKSEKLAHALAFSFCDETLTMPGSIALRSSTR